MNVNNIIYQLTITADSIVSTDPNFSMDNLYLGDNFKAVEVWFEDENGNKVVRNRNRNERAISGQTLPRLACQIYESQLSALSLQEKTDFVICQYKPNGTVFKGIYPTVTEFRKQYKSIEFVKYSCSDGSNFVIYCWNIFSTLLFVKGCLEKFTSNGEKFILTYCEKPNKDKNKNQNNMINNDQENTQNNGNNISIVEPYSLNTILYGPPGTGKTYNSVKYAVAIIEEKDINVIMAEDYADVKKRYDNYKSQGLIAFTTFHQSYGYEEFIEGIKPVVSNNTATGNKDIQYEIIPGTFKRFCEMSNIEKNRVFIIDEINRGNISKIFGELITLIEDTKRLGMPEETKSILPYSGKPFGVPANIYILGTMNTADRSITQIDTALRRRFSFIEMMPNPSILDGIDVEGINISNMLDIINRRIEVLYDREHTIGHAFFTILRDDPTIEKLANIFKKSIIPLLKEYFYEDYSKIRLVLGDNKKSKDAQFITEEVNDYSVLFGDVEVGLDDGCRYEINEDAFTNIEAYRSI